MEEMDTGELQKILLGLGTQDAAAYEERFLSGISDLSFGDYYRAVLARRGCSRAEAIDNSGLEVHYAYQILSGERHAKRDKLICLCIGGGFSLQETNRALERAAVGALYPKRMRDAVILIAINRGIRTVWQVNELLSQRELELLG